MQRLAKTTVLSRGLLRNRRAVIAAAKRRHAYDVRVFGSVARGSDTDTSDVDLLVSVDANARPMDLVGFACDVEEFLGVEVDVATLESLRPGLRDEVLADAVRL